MESKATIKPDIDFLLKWNFKTAKQVSVLLAHWFSSSLFIKDFFDVDTAWKSFWVEYKCSNSKFESSNPVLLLRLRQKIIYWWFYIFFAVNSL
jgi:hypothetical protein